MEVIKEKTVILGSASPRRHELLSAMGIDHEVFSIDADETIPDGLEPTAIAEYLADYKSTAFPRDLADDELLITADTIVVSGDQILNKPEDAAEAERMIRSLSGREHDVITGCCVRSGKRSEVFHSKTTVRFAALSTEMIEHYIEQFKPYDKAGAYGIQEWIGLVGIEGIEGSYFNVVGLPTQKLYEVLSSF